MATMFTFRKYNSNITNEHPNCENMVYEDGGLQQGDFTFFLDHNFEDVFNTMIETAKNKFDDFDRLYWFQIKPAQFTEGMRFSFFGTENAIRQFKNVLASKHVIIRMPMGEVIWSNKD